LKIQQTMHVDQYFT